MVAKQIWLGVYEIPCGAVNTFLIDGGSDGLILIDAGFPGKADKIFDGIRNVGFRPSDLKHVVLTHAHYDHIGGLADVVKVTGATTWMSAIDAPIAEKGSGFRLLKPAPEWIPAIMYRLVYKADVTVDPARIDHTFADGDVLPLAGGLKAIGTPGHCAGQMSLLWLGHRVLFVGDACTRLFGELNSPVGYEDEAEGRRSQKKLCGFDYELACFGHGPSMSGHAAQKMRRKWLHEPAAEQGETASAGHH